MEHLRSYHRQQFQLQSNLSMRQRPYYNHVLLESVLKILRKENRHFRGVHHRCQQKFQGDEP